MQRGHEGKWQKERSFNLKPSGSAIRIYSVSNCLPTIVPVFKCHVTEGQTVCEGYIQTMLFISWLSKTNLLLTCKIHSIQSISNNIFSSQHHLQSPKTHLNIIQIQCAWDLEHGSSQGRIPIQLGTCKARQIMCFQNIMTNTDTSQTSHPRGDK